MEDIYARAIGRHVKIVGPQGGELILLEPESAIKLAHDILDKAGEVLKKHPEESTAH